MSSLPAEVESAIVAACREHQAHHGLCRAGCVAVDYYVVKYGDPAVLDCDVKTRVFLTSTEPQPNKPRIPKLIHRFDNGQGTAYVVLEHVKLAESPADLAERMDAAVTWLSGLQAPPGHKLGPLGGGRIRHAFFNSQEAPLSFESVEALERYVEKGRRKLHKHGESVHLASLTDERLLCMQGNLDKSHFGVDEAGRTVLMGLRSISFVPETFARHTLVKAKLTTLADRLCLSGESNMKAMAAIAYVLGMTADSTLGLDNKGKTAKKKTTVFPPIWLVGALLICMKPHDVVLPEEDDDHRISRQYNLAPSSPLTTPSPSPLNPLFTLPEEDAAIEEPRAPIRYTR